MKHFTFHIPSIIAGTILFAMSACHSSTDVEYELQSAETAIAHGDIKAATSVANTLSDSIATPHLSAKQLARLSIIYMQIADSAENGINVAKATDIYRKAYRVNPDSAAQYYSALPAEKAQYLMMLSSIVASQDHPYDIEADIHADSILLMQLDEEEDHK